MAVLRLITNSYFHRRLHQQVGGLVALEDAIDTLSQEVVRVQAAQLHPQQRDGVVPIQRDDGVVTNLLARHQDRWGS